MNCKNVQSLLSAYLDEELSGREMLDIRQHLHDCGDCGHELRCIEGVKRILGSAVPEPSPDFEDRLVSHVLSASPTPNERRTSFLTLSLIATASMIATLLVLGFVHRQSIPPAETGQGIPYDVMRQDQAFDARWDGMGGGALYISAKRER